MRTLLFMVVLAAAPLAAQQPPPDSGAPTPQNRREVLLRLRDHVSQAMANANLTDSQKKMLENAQAMLRDATQKRGRGERPERGKVRDALRDIQSVFQSDALRPEDRETVQKDLRDWRELRAQGARRRP